MGYQSCEPGGSQPVRATTAFNRLVRLDGVNGTAVEHAPSRPSSARVRPEVNARDALELDQEVSLTDWGV